MSLIDKKKRQKKKISKKESLKKKLSSKDTETAKRDLFKNFDFSQKKKDTALKVETLGQALRSSSKRAKKNKKKNKPDDWQSIEVKLYRPNCPEKTTSPSEDDPIWNIAKPIGGKGNPSAKVKVIPLACERCGKPCWHRNWAISVVPESKKGVYEPVIEMWCLECLKLTKNRAFNWAIFSSKYGYLD